MATTGTVSAVVEFGSVIGVTATLGVAGAASETGASEGATVGAGGVVSDAAASTVDVVVSDVGATTAVSFEVFFFDFFDVGVDAPFLAGSPTEAGLASAFGFGGATVDEATTTRFSTIWVIGGEGTGARGLVGFGRGCGAGSGAGAVAARTGGATATGAATTGAAVTGTVTVTYTIWGAATMVAGATVSGVVVAGMAVIAFRLPGRKPSQPLPVTAEAVTTPDMAMISVVAEYASAVFRFIG